MTPDVTCQEVCMSDCPAFFFLIVGLHCVQLSCCITINACPYCYSLQLSWICITIELSWNCVLQCPYCDIVFNFPGIVYYITINACQYCDIGSKCLQLSWFLGCGNARPEGNLVQCQVTQVPPQQSTG